MFRKFPIWKRVWIKGGVSRFSVGVFLSHKAKKLRGGNPFMLQETFGMKKVKDKRGGTTVFWKNFFPRVPNHFVSGTLVFEKRSGTEKFCILELSGFLDFFCLSTEKFCWGSLW